MIHIKRTIILYPQLLHGKDGDYYNIIIRVTCAGARKNFSTGISVPVYQFDRETRQFVGDAQGSDEARSCFALITALEDIFTEFEVVEKRVPTMHEVSRKYDAYRGRANRLGREDVFQYAIVEFMREQSVSKSWSDSTIKKFNTLKTHFQNFDPDLRFSNFDKARFEEFISYLAQKRRFVNTTLQKYVRFVSWFLNWGASKGYYKGDAHLTYKPKFKGGDGEFKDIVYLTLDELQTLEAMTFTRDQQYLERVRDCFLFCCYSGLRFSDLENLRRSDIHGNCIHVLQIKVVGETLHIDLNRHTRALLDKYKDAGLPNGKALPVVSNQKSNDYLHKVCKMAGFDAPMRKIWFEGSTRKEAFVPRYDMITFHAGRRTFITHAVRLGIPVPVIMKFSGHHSPEMLKPYLAIADDLRSHEMAKFDAM